MHLPPLDVVLAALVIAAGTDAYRAVRQWAFDMVRRVWLSRREAKMALRTGHGTGAGGDENDAADAGGGTGVAGAHGGWTANL